MSSNDPGLRRVMVALGFGAPTPLGLDAAVTLAASAAAELHGIFVEDEELIRVAALPVTRVLGYRSPVRREISVEEMERELGVQARRAEARFHAAAAQAKLGSSFRVTRGRVVAQVAAARAEAELVLVDRSRAPLPRNGKKASLPAALYDGEESSERVLEAAALLAPRSGGKVAVLATGPGPEAATLAGQRAAAWLRARGVEPRVMVIGPPTADRILAATRAAGAAALVFRWSAVRERDDLDRLLLEAPLPIVISGPPGR
ncbi:MAG: hypothetical protein U0359_02725 [Byssovorax sp.]